MIRSAAVLLVTTASLGFVSQGAAQETLAIRCGRLIDGRSDTPVSNVTIVVRGDRIVEIGPRPDVPNGARRIDLSRGTCLPGLMDLHAHILLNPSAAVQNDLSRSSADRALDGLRNAQKMLHAGFTTLRDPGDFDAYYASVAVRDAIAAGSFEGPRLFVAPHTLSITGGHGDINNLAPDLDIMIPTRIVNGPDEMRRTIREQVKYGADWIKLMATGGVMSAGDDPNLTAFTVEELRAAVDETHRHGKRITVHAIGTAGIKDAVRAGVNSVEHGILIDDEGIQLMKERGTWLIPTVYVLNYILEEGENLGYAEESIAKARELVVERDRRIGRAFAAGVKIAYGSDTIFPHEFSAREFSAMVALGLSTMDAIRAATGNAAEVLGIENDVGTLVPGMMADIVGVLGNPLDDISILEDIKFVMKDGSVVKNDLPRT